MSIIIQTIELNAKDESIEDIQNEEQTEKKDAEKETITSDINDVFAADSEDEGDEDILAACINMGMQTNR